MELNWADFAVIGIILISTLISLIRGFIKEAVSLSTWVAATWAVFFYDKGGLTQSFAAQLVGISELEWLRLVVAGIAIFIIILILGAIVNYTIGQLVEKTGFSGTDRTLGTVFGILRGVLVVGLVIMLAGLTTFPQDSWWKQSLLLPLFQEKVIMYKAYLPDQIGKNFDFSREANSTSPAPATAPPGNTQQPKEATESPESTLPVTKI